MSVEQIVRTQVKTTWPRFMLESVHAGNELTNLLPTHTKSWWPLVEDVFRAPVVVDLTQGLLQQASEHGECEYLSVDGTFRVCFSLLGQARFDASAETKASYPFGRDTAMTRVISIRGRTGAVLGLLPSVDESPAELCRCIRESLPDEGLLSIRHVATDAPSKKLHGELATMLPNFEGLSLDPTHAAMRYEQATGGRKTEGSMLLRCFMSKFCGYDSSADPKIWGPMFDGNFACQLSPQEQSLRQQIETSSMSKAKAARVIAEVKPLQIWPTRIQFVEALASLSSTFKSEMTRKLEGTKMTVARMLHSLASPEKMEYLFNSLRYRHTVPQHIRVLLPSGTTANEALHAELKLFFRQIQSMHRSTLTLKLNILRLGKLLSHNLALYSPTARQMPAVHILARRLGQSLWTEKAWTNWVEAGHKHGAILPQKAKRLHEQQLVQSIKRPAHKSCRKRTAFTLERGKRVRRTGVYKRPASRKSR
eukprot:s3264_g6.t1